MTGQLGGKPKSKISYQVAGLILSYKPLYLDLLLVSSQFMDEECCQNRALSGPVEGFIFLQFDFSSESLNKKK